MTVDLIDMKNYKKKKKMKIARTNNINWIFTAWFLGAFFCKAVSYLQGVSVSASVNTLMAISIERCMAISCPLSPSMSSK